MVKIGKFDLKLTPDKLVAAIALVAGVAALAVYIVFYLPLMGQLRIKYVECKSLEADAFEMRYIIDTAGKVYGERVLPTEEEVYQAIDELSKGGERKGVNFISMQPKDVQALKGTEYKILPIEMEVESSYEDLGRMLGSLDDLEKGVVKVKSFDIDRDKENPSKFRTDVTIEVYISGRSKADE